MTDDVTVSIPTLADSDLDDTAILVRSTRKTVHTVRHMTSAPRNMLYDVQQGNDRYYVVAPSDDDAFRIAAQRMILRSELGAFWPPLISEVIR